ncbi:MAG: DUF3168 domain-containing protein [Alphaproteobacteria bacterium]|nr:DUF3168 domain-containing protein [Alphaproteobacteria bacterium]
MSVVETGLAVQKAVYQAIAAAVAGLSPVPGVYDDVPDGADLPYVTLDMQDTQPMDGLTARRDEIRYYATVWSDYAGAKQVNEILAAIRPALHEVRLTLEAGTMIGCSVLRMRTARDVDDKTYQGLFTLRIRVFRGDA